MASVTNSTHRRFDPAVTLQARGKQPASSFDQKFALGHQLWRANKPVDSTQAFHALYRLKPTYRPVRLMLARCLARVKQFHDCHQLLAESFENDRPDLVSQLHEAFVMRAIGNQKEALQNLSAIAQEHKDLPTICLILGDLWERSGDVQRARGLWEMAARRANERGPVAYSARAQIATLPTANPGK